MNEEQQYIRGFNAGYLLAKYEPILLNSIKENLQPSVPFLNGMYSGKDQFELDYTYEQMKDLRQIRNSSRDLGKGREQEF